MFLVVFAVAESSWKKQSKQLNGSPYRKDNMEKGKRLIIISDFYLCHVSYGRRIAFHSSELTFSHTTS